jgi:crotonobetainyl-CoA:carnitine CoA-transferase CaiB-like acyl-CoA transferase
MLGEHSRAVLAEFGYSPSAVDALVADGIVRVPR